MVNPNAVKVESTADLIYGSSGICLDGRENRGSGQGKLLHKGAYSSLLHAWRKALSAERIQALCSAAPPGLAKPRQRIDAHRRSAKQIPEEPYLPCLSSKIYSLGWLKRSEPIGRL